MKNWMFLKDFDDELSNFKPFIVIHNKLFDFLKYDCRWHEFLRIALSFGNSVNAGTARAGAYGFKLKTLPKFFDTKDNEGLKSILHFLLHLSKKQD